MQGHLFDLYCRKSCTNIIETDTNRGLFYVTCKSDKFLLWGSCVNSVNSGLILAWNWLDFEIGPISVSWMRAPEEKTELRHSHDGVDHYHHNYHHHHLHYHQHNHHHCHHHHHHHLCCWHHHLHHHPQLLMKRKEIRWLARGPVASSMAASAPWRKVILEICHHHNRGIALPQFYLTSNFEY